MNHFSTTMLAFGIMLAALPAARAADTTCTAPLVNTTVNGNLIVPDGATCRLEDVIVTGNVLVGTGASLFLTGSGSVVTISGNLQANECGVVQMFAAESPVSVGGNVAIQSCTGQSGFEAVGYLAGGTPGAIVTIHGNFLCQFNSVPCFANLGSIAGNANVSQNSGGTSEVAGWCRILRVPYI